MWLPTLVHTLATLLLREWHTTFTVIAPGDRAGEDQLQCNLVAVAGPCVESASGC